LRLIASVRQPLSWRTDPGERRLPCDRNGRRDGFGDRDRGNVRRRLCRRAGLDPGDLADPVPRADDATVADLQHGRAGRTGNRDAKCRSQQHKVAKLEQISPTRFRIR
jgi:hypothetical protein